MSRSFKLKNQKKEIEIVENQEQEKHAKIKKYLVKRKNRKRDLFDEVDYARDGYRV